MRIVSWNINGLISWTDSNAGLAIKKLAPDIFCCQETRTRQQIEVLDGYYHYWHPCEKDGLHGTLTATREKPQNVFYGMDDPELDAEGRVLTVEFPSIFVVNCYAPRSVTLERKDFRLRWDEALQSFADRLIHKGKNIVFCGDFNALRSELDVYPENDRQQAALEGILSDERANIEKLLEMGFVDAFRHLHPDERYAYTWWSARKNRRPQNRGWRLDYFFVSDKAVKWVKAVQHLAVVKGSDHAPILLDIDMEAEEDHLAKEWNAIDWQAAEKKLENYQERLTRAAFQHDMQDIVHIQRKIANSGLIKQLAVRHVAQRTNTAGVDHIRWMTDADKMRAAKKLNKRPYYASPLREIIIVDKSSGKERHIGIPTMMDRAMNVLYGYGLAPIVEAWDEAESFGFRRGRSTMDTHATIMEILEKPRSPEFVVYGDVQSFYASVSHDWIMKHIPLDPIVLNEFLTMGHVFAGELRPADEYGMSEGASISPMIANLILRGLQNRIYSMLNTRAKSEPDYDNGRMIRYVDDILVFVRDKKTGEKVIKCMEMFFRERGLALSPQKTYLTSVAKGFNFLSRTYKVENGRIRVRPSDKAVARFIASLGDTVRRCRNKSQRDIIRTLNKKLKGWAFYHRVTDATEAFKRVDVAVQSLLLALAFEKHPKMDREKVLAKYWYKAHDGTPVYALPDDKTVVLIRLEKTVLIRHAPVDTGMNPYIDEKYFEVRNREREIQHVAGQFRAIWNRQQGRCFYCGRPILADQHKALVQIDPRRAASTQTMAYIHKLCQKSEVEYIGLMDDPYELSPLNILGILEEVDRMHNQKRHWNYADMRRTIHHGDTKYTHIWLKRFFSLSIKPRIVLTFQQIGEIEGRKLHPASKKESFWSEEKKGYNSIAATWKSEGYELAKLDLAHEKIILTRVNPDSLLKVPQELTKQRLPKDAIYELEKFFAYIIEKYAL